MVQHLGDADWRSIAEQASKETDPAKLTILVEKLCCALEGERRSEVSGNQPGSFLSN